MSSTSAVLSSVAVNVHVPTGQQPPTSAGRAGPEYVPLILKPALHRTAFGLSEPPGPIGWSSPMSPSPTRHAPRTRRAAGHSFIMRSVFRNVGATHTISPSNELRDG